VGGVGLPALAHEVDEASAARASRPPRRAAAPGARPGPAAEAAPYRVLVVDDNEPLRALYRGLLAADGRFEVVAEAPDGVQALALVREHDPDVLLLDLAMPRLDGVEVVTALRAERRSVRVVVYTGYDSPSLRERLAKLDVSGFVAKGAPPDDVLAAVAAAGDEARTSRV
jgi:DNA-binding NarL/FixJ family response regulator